MQYLYVYNEDNFIDNESQLFFVKPDLQLEIQANISTKQFYSHDSLLDANEQVPFLKQIKGVKSFQQNTIFEQKNLINSIKSIDKKSKIQKPGETKNLPKNVLGGLMKFIESILENKQIENFYDYVEDLDWKTLKSVPKSQITKNTLKNFLSTKIGRLFGKQYFGQCHWAQNFVKQNKTKSSLYYKHNLTYYRMSVPKQQEPIQDEEIFDYSQNGLGLYL